MSAIDNAIDNATEGLATRASEAASPSAAPRPGSPDEPRRAAPAGAGAARAAVAAIGWEEAILPALSEAEFASWQRELGHRVIEWRGRYWHQTVPGFCQPIHPLARLRWEEATRPTRWCWALRARLAAEDEGGANAAIPAHLLPDLPGYGLQRLSKRRRQEIKAALRELDVVALLAPGILLDQGYRLAREAHAQRSHVRLPSPAHFRRTVESYARPGRGLALAALRQGGLIGFTLCHSVDGVAYEYMGFIGREGFQHHVSLCLFHALAMIARRSPGTTELVNGTTHLRENQGLCAFKRSQGLEVTAVPARVWFAPLAEGLLRRFRPHAYYRATGRG